MLLQINDAVSNVESESFSTHEAWHKSTLKSLSSSSPAENDDSEMLLYSYTPSLCNKKLIRALSFSKGQLQTKDHDYDLPRDFFGHRTHTPSTAAGNHNAIIAIGSLSAVEKGTVFVCAAGNNNGPSDNSTYNGAPWITTVGAGTLDRTFSATFTLDNGFTIEGSYVHEC
ncbi:hypothetical protein C1H46_027484 [Malus baccata]|uniref:Peptidase S8/S53 domain-containing protein n=1 Tax=Malus baccata TaxID=106549 RepID=A0A540LKH7_MALBA|nr:hypothetical protein C1H46_027484 [Malus baccata]